MMLWTCKRTQKLLELNENTDLPEWAENHLRGCSHCRQVAERELDIRHVLHAVRSESVPVSRLEWSQIRTRLQPQTARRAKQRIPQYVLAGSVSMAVLWLVFILQPFFAGEQGRASSRTHPEKRVAAHQPDSTAHRTTHNGAAHENIEGDGIHVLPGQSSPAALKPGNKPANQRIVATRAGNAGPIDEKAGRPIRSREAAVTNGYTVLPENSLEAGTRLEVAFAPSVGEESNHFHLVPEHHPGADALPLPAIRCEGTDANYLQVNYVSEANEAYAF